MCAIGRQYFETIRVDVSADENGVRMKANVLFDLGSMKTYVTKAFAEKMQLRQATTERVKIGAFGDKEGKMNFLDVFVLHFNAIDGGNLKITGSAVPTICAPFDDMRPYVDELRKRFNVREYLPDEHVVAGEIDILVGGDFYWSIVSREVIDLTDNLVLKPSKIGYLLSGSEYSPDIEHVSTYATTCVQTLVTTNRYDDDDEELVSAHLSKPSRDTTATGEKVTKRSILRVVAGFYDPPGWIQPAMIKLKILFQEAWTCDAEWDDELPRGLAGRMRWRDAISEMLQIRKARRRRLIDEKRRKVREVLGRLEIQALGPFATLPD